jgi:hypothetical protein
MNIDFWPEILRFVKELTRVTKATGHSPSWKTISRLPSKLPAHTEMKRSLQLPKTPSVFHILIQINPFHNFVHFHFTKNFNTVFSSMPRSKEMCLPFSFTNQYLLCVRRESVVGIAARHGLGVWDRNPLGERFCVTVRTGPGAHLTSCNSVSGHSRGQSGSGVALTSPLSSTKVRERVELYPYSPLCLHGRL